MTVRHILGFRQKSQLYQSTDENFGVLNTVDKLSPVVCGFPLFSPQRHMLQDKNLRDHTLLTCNLVLRLQRADFNPAFKKQAKQQQQKTPVLCQHSVLCQFSASHAKLLSIQSFFWTIYIFWKKGCMHTLSFLFCQTSSAPYCRKEEVRWAQTSQKFQRHSATVNLIFQTPICILRYTGQFISTALTRKKKQTR